MIAATLFSGIGGAEQAMPHWQWLWCAEIEAFPSAVLAKRHPHTVNLGDVNAPDFVERASAIGRPDVIVFGSPCQDFSVAGRRLGLDGARGNLALIALGIISRLKPGWFVFENVPGLLSNWSGGPECPDGAGSTINGIENSDFAAFLGLVDELGYSGAWASLDAQWFGLAQRRERLFFVGSSGDWRGPAAVLFESESLRGDRPPSRATGERVTGTVEARTSAGGAGWGTDFMCGGGLAAEDEPAFALKAGKSPTGNLRGEQSDNLVVDLAKSVPARPWAAHREDSDTLVVAGAVSRKWSKGTGGPSGDECYNLVADPISANEGRTYTHEGANNFRLHNVVTAFDTTQITSPDNRNNPQPDDACHPLAADAHPPAIAFTCKDHGGDASELAPTLRAMGHDASHANAGGQIAVAFQSSQSGMREVEAHATLDANNGSRRHNGVAAGTAVRRLTPLECARLQGFPDDYLDIRYRGKPAADGNKYKALGNAMAVPVLRWILARIEAVEALRK